MLLANFEYKDLTC